MHQVGGANRFITQGMPSLIILFSVVVDCFLDARGVKSRPGRGLSSPVLQAVSLGLITLTLISGSPWMAWLRSNAPLLETDIWLARLGLQIGEATDGDVIVAAHAIGQISYYSDRRMVDLLGINDRVVAAGHPATSFRPGHNKWNYAYSISALRPDLVADEWGESNVYLADQPDYYQLENGIWLRKGGPRVDVEKLAQPYR
jgi:hypothetical protein